MKIMFLNQLSRHKKLMVSCTPAKVTKQKMEEAADQAALVQSLVGEVRAQVPIPEDSLYAQFVKLWVENDPQVHLDVNSVWATKADDFAPQSLDVINGLPQRPPEHPHH